MSILTNDRDSRVSLWAVFVAFTFFLLNLMLVVERYNSHKGGVETEYESRTVLKLTQVKTALSAMAGDVSVLSQFPSLQNCLVLRCTDDASLISLEKDLLFFARAYKQYTQIRVLDDTGFEIFRWNYDKTKESLTAAINLQDKSSRYYVKNALTLNPEEIYFSAVDHNIENGSLEYPLTPTIRALRKIVLNGSEYLVVLNRDLSQSVDASVGVSFADADADADADLPILRLVYDIDHSIRTPNTDVSIGPLFSTSEMADIASLTRLSHQLMEFLQPSMFDENKAIHNLDTGTLIVIKEPLFQNPSIKFESPLRIVAYLPNGYLLGRFWDKNWIFVLITFALSALMSVLLIAKLRKGEELRRQDITLRHVVDELEQSVSQLKDTREKQGQMLSVISHELRTPIASSAMIYGELDRHSLNEYLPTLKANSESILSILDDLRMVIRPEEIRERDNTVDLPGVIVERTIASLANLAEQHNIQIHLSFDTASQQPMLFKASVLRQVVTNLVKNAMLHSNGANVWVNLTAMQPKQNESEIVLTIEDDGEGISPDFQKTMYQAFSRGETSSEGTGLGLFIIKELAESLNGEITYFSSLKGGAGFKLSARFSTEIEQDNPEEPSYTDEQLTQTLAGMNVLFAEDQPTIQMLTKGVLTKAGAEVTIASNGQLALSAFYDVSPDIVITDAMMPEMDGYELSTRLRAEGYKGPIIAVTAATIGDERDRLIAAGADAVLPKPINVDELKLALANWEQNQTAV